MNAECNMIREQSEQILCKYRTIQEKEIKNLNKLLNETKEQMNNKMKVYFFYFIKLNKK